MRTTMKMLTVLRAAAGGGVPTNTVAPAISADAVIGTELTVTPGTWTMEPVLTYQWQRNTGVWVDIAGATNSAYTPVDADFGYALRVLEIPNGNTAGAAASNETALTAEVPAQSLGAELLVNGSMEAGDPPSSWSAGAGGYNPATLAAEAEERTGGSGSQSLKIVRVTSQFDGATQAATIPQGSLIDFDSWIRNIDANAGVRASMNLADGTAIVGAVTFYTGTTWRNQRGLGIKATAAALPAAIGMNASANGQSALGDDFSVRIVTPNTQLTAPSANMDVAFFYELPAAPGVGTQVWLLPRISNYASGNYWLALLEYTGTQWRVTLYSVATHARTATLATAGNIGVTDGLRVVANGDNIDLYTTANGGTDWTKRGSTVTSSLYGTATGVNVAYTRDITPELLTYDEP